jgi:hypothetical protein
VIGPDAAYFDDALCAGAVVEFAVATRSGVYVAEDIWHGIMSVVKCDVCRSYYHHPEPGHTCPGLRSVDWVRFSRSLRHWMSTDSVALFEAYYARRSRGSKQDEQDEAA